MARTAKKKITFYIVTCEGHSEAWVNAPDWPRATVAAAAFWDVPWREVAAKCECKMQKDAIYGVCPKCGHFFYGGANLCAMCQKALADDERNLRQYLKNRYGRDKKRA